MGGKTSAASKNKWAAKAYDRVNLTLPKGKKERLQTHAENRGESVNGFINRAIDEAMERDQQKTAPLSGGGKNDDEAGAENSPCFIIPKRREEARKS